VHLFQNKRAKSEDVNFDIYTSTKAETLVKTGSVVVEIFGNIGQFWPNCMTIFIFSPTLTQKLLNRFSPSFSHDVEQLVAHFIFRNFFLFLSCLIHAHIHKAISHSVSE